jgi:hypothetical protein
MAQDVTAKAIISVESETFKRISYTAEVARKTASGAKIILEMKKVFDAIRAAAEDGSFAMEFPAGVLADDHKTILEHLGYKLSTVPSETGHRDVVGW